MSSEIIGLLRSWFTASVGKFAALGVDPYQTGPARHPALIGGIQRVEMQKANKNSGGAFAPAV
ncbi:hypothetical protein [Hoeflea ulvae]|uniref:Uncharacterized protein n=1 Tax=Hoeflea ulvae TaxID=2983764 RepID=A0ABT3YAM7_9HYPH|nr:hypothetical protein [Hoeflea ulvae]MCY0092777.1 hypothetical protein [Hoeflea ulvae]